MVAVLQVSLALEAAFTLTSVGSVVALRQASVAVTVKSRVVTQPVVESAAWLTVIVAVLQVTRPPETATTLPSAGLVRGLQPKAKPVVGTVRLGPVVSTVQL